MMKFKMNRKEEDFSKVIVGKRINFSKSEDKFTISIKNGLVKEINVENNEITIDEPCYIRKFMDMLIEYIGADGDSEDECEKYLYPKIEMR